MTQTTHPSKELVRQHMQQRVKDHTPPPTPEQVRRELGWELIPHDPERGKLP